MNRRVEDARRFYTTLPMRSRVILLLAVFSTFTSAGFVLDILSTGWPQPRLVSLILALASGFISVLYVLSVFRGARFIPVAIALHLLIFWKLPAWLGVHPAAPGAIPDMAEIHRRLQFDGRGCMLGLVLGYVLFFNFIRGQGIRHTRIHAEVALARGIHESLVPPISRTWKGFEVLGRSLPSSEVGGDLVDAFESDGCLVLCVADVAGHGVQAGALMAMVKSVLRTRLREPAPLERLLADANRLLLDLERPDRFVTIACMRVDERGRLEHALAGHPPLLHWSAARRSITRVDSRNVPLGVSANVAFEVDSLDLAAGDLLVAHTDGFTEVFNRAGEQFGLERLEQLVATHATQALPQLFERVTQAVRAHGRQTDDQTLLLLRVDRLG